MSYTYENMTKEELQKYGSIGGKAKNPKKGFGSLSKKAARENASKAAKARWEKHEDSKEDDGGEQTTVHI